VGSVRAVHDLQWTALLCNDTQLVRGSVLDGPPRSPSALVVGQSAMRDPTEQTSAQFLPVHLALVQPGTVPPVALYLRAGAGEQFTLYCAAHTTFDEEARGRLLEHGVQALYVRLEDEGAHSQYVEQNIEAIIRDDLLPPGEASRLVYETSSRLMQHVFDDPRSGRNIARVEPVVRAAVRSLMRNPDTLWEITDLASHDYRTYTHSVNVSVLLVAFSLNVLSIQDASALESIGFGGMVHDLGKSMVPAEILNKAGPLTDEEFEKVQEHPLTGLSLVECHRELGTMETAIIRSHHERPDGRGYPDQLEYVDIPRMARVAKVLDCYDAMTTDRPYARARSPYETLRIMKRMDGHFDETILNGFIRFLGPEGDRSQ
jgi:HD-GYP domain-containing protein (c-di-GMP phosphodiesterase class II)